MGLCLNRLVNHHQTVWGRISPGMSRCLTKLVKHSRGWRWVGVSVVWSVITSGGVEMGRSPTGLVNYCQGDGNGSPWGGPREVDGG